MLIKMEERSKIFETHVLQMVGLLSLEILLPFPMMGKTSKLKEGKICFII